MTTSWSAARGLIPSENEDALLQIWRSQNPFDVRAAEFIEQSEIAADSTQDTLYGGNGENLFLASENDILCNGGTEPSLTIPEATELGWAQPHDLFPGIFIVMAPSVENDAALGSVSLWNNPVNPMDVNNDGNVTPIDALITINQLNVSPGGELTESSYYVDTNGDGLLSPIDVLLVISAINNLFSSGEGEAMESAPLPLLSQTDGTSSLEAPLSFDLTSTTVSASAVDLPNQCDSQAVDGSSCFRLFTASKFANLGATQSKPFADSPARPDDLDGMHQQDQQHCLANLVRHGRLPLHETAVAPLPDDARRESLLETIARDIACAAQGEPADRINSFRSK